MKHSVNLTEAANILKSDLKTIKSFIEEMQLQPIISKGSIHYKNLPYFFSLFQNKYGLKDKNWAIPKCLLSSPDPSMKTLVDLYSHQVSFPASLPSSQGKIIHDLVLRIKPTIAVEIGCFIGVSSVWIGSALKKNNKGHLYSIDLFNPKFPYPPFHWGFLENPMEFTELNIKNAELHEQINILRMKSSNFVKKIKKRNIDFLFIDGDHSIGGCIDDFFNYYPYIKKNGTIILHDIYPENCGWTGPRYLLDHLIIPSKKFEVTEIETTPNYGIAIIKKLTDDTTIKKWKCLKNNIYRQLYRLTANFKNSFFVQYNLYPKLVKAFKFNLSGKI